MRRVEERVRQICTAFPEVTEKLSHGAPAFFAGAQGTPGTNSNQGKHGTQGTAGTHDTAGTHSNQGRRGTHDTAGTDSNQTRRGTQGKQFVMLWPDGHHEDRFPHLWCAAPPGAQGALIAEDGERFFRPPYVGGRGWIGIRLDGPVDWDEVAALCEDAYRCVAPSKLVALLDAPPPADG